MSKHFYLCTRIKEHCVCVYQLNLEWRFTCTERGNTWRGSGGSRRLSSLWFRSLWRDTAERDGTEGKWSPSPTSELYTLKLVNLIKKNSTPHTSAAGTFVSPSPSPLRFLLRWTLFESSRAASRAPASPFQSSLWGRNRSKLIHWNTFSVRINIILLN